MDYVFYDAVKRIVPSIRSYDEFPKRGHIHMTVARRMRLSDRMITNLKETLDTWRIAESLSFVRGHRNITIKGVKFPVTKFDPYTFNPRWNNEHGRALQRLRVVGGLRDRDLRRERNKLSRRTSPRPFFDIESTGSQYIPLPQAKDAVFVGAGCGESPDTQIALLHGYKQAYGIDCYLFNYDFSSKPDRYNNKNNRFIQADVSRCIPLPNNSADAVLAQALIDLIDPDKRIGFYREAFRVLKPGGYLSVYITPLRHGWGSKLSVERRRAFEVGFEQVTTFSLGILLIKPQEQL